MKTEYDKIGENYDATRKADPEILAQLKSLLDIQSSGVYLDIGCGSGNYSTAMSEFGGKWHAFDSSKRMLAAAKRKSNLVKWHLFDVNNIELDSNSFDGAICTLAIHHFPDILQAFSEISRVLKTGSSLVLFTSTPLQMRYYWLHHYFPKMMAKSSKQMPSIDTIIRTMLLNGLEIESTQLYFITPNLQDFFLYSGKQRPEIYLSASVRAGISSFRNFCTENELKSGLQELKQDIESGKIESVIGDYFSKLGDYLFVVASKTSE